MGLSRAIARLVVARGRKELPSLAGQPVVPVSPLCGSRGSGLSSSGKRGSGAREPRLCEKSAPPRR
eukprot:7556090-Alexandrium_andersonii.AAC.1